MLASGKTPNNRFDAAREILERFVLSRQQDRIGLVVFGPEAWLGLAGWLGCYPDLLDRMVAL